MKFFLFSKQKCWARIGEKFVDLKNLVEVENNTPIDIFPQAEKFKPVLGCVGFDRGCFSKIEFEKYVLVEFVPELNFNLVCFKNKAFKGGEITVISQPSKVLVSAGADFFAFDCPKNFTKIQIVDMQNAVFVSNEEDNNNFSVCFHKKMQKFVFLDGPINVQGVKVEVLKNKHTLAGHGELETYGLDAEKIEFLNSEPVYLYQKPQVVPPFLNHIAFFEAVRERDFNLAKTYLTPALTEALTDQHLLSFFGEFDKVKPMHENGKNKIALIKKVSNNYAVAKVFVLEMLGEKINNIFEN